VQDNEEMRVKERERGPDRLRKRNGDIVRDEKEKVRVLEIEK
jgi:hypothetical protein